jgi:predicted Zn finger-like uncharacterized protein
MMIIECQACRARFKLDESRIKGKGARIRCRKCGESIVVMKSDIAPPGPSPSIGKELFDLRAVLHEPERRIPVSPRGEAGTPLDPPIAREQEREPSPPFASEEPEPPAEAAEPPAEFAPPKQDEIDAVFESPLFREEEEPSPPPASEEPGLQEEAAEPPAEFAPPRQDEIDAVFESPLFREEEPPPPHAMEEPEPPEEREAFPGEVAEPPAEPAPPPQDEVSDAFEALFQSDRPREIFPEEPAPPGESPDTPFPIDTEDGEDLIVFRKGGEDTLRSLHDAPDRETPGAPPQEGGGGWEFLREPGEDLTLDPDLPGFLRKEQSSGTPAASFDISEHLREAPVETPEEDAAPGPATTDPFPSPAEPSLSRADVIQDELADLVESGPPEETPGPESPPPDVPPPRPPERESTEVMRPRRSAPSGRPSIALLVILFVTLAGGGAYLAFTKTGQETLRSIVPGMEALWLGGKESVTPYHVGNLIGYYETGDKAGKMFIIKGLATNQGRTKKSAIRIRAELLDGGNQRIAEKTVYAGNVITGLRASTRERIEAAMGNRFGDKLSNVDVAPGKSIPFMVAFFDPPDGIEEYRLEALDGD